VDEHDIPYLHTLRGQLVGGVAARQRRVRRTRLVVRATAVAAAVVAATAAGITLLGGQSGTPSADAAVLRHTRAAVTPSGSVILHVKAVATLDGSRVDYESWQLSSAPYSYRRIKGPTESSFDGSTVETYDASTGTITEQPASQPQSFDDPVAKLRELLAGGDAHIVGRTTIGGRDVYEITTHSDDAILNGTVYADATTYAPVRADLEPPSPCPPDGCMGPETIDFLAYEQLAATGDNMKLLSVAAQHPHASVVTAPAPTSTAETTTTSAPKTGGKPTTGGGG
jgi:hypothetical protein